MIARNARWVAGFVLLATACGFLATRLAFVPVPWADGSAFYLAGLDLVQWPPRWVMHNQAAFVPSYDQANFNIMPALPLLLGLFGRSGLPHLINPELLIRVVSLLGLLAYVWLLWSWMLESLINKKNVNATQGAYVTASLLAAAALWDPLLRWGTFVVRTETWIGLCWLWIVRELHRAEMRGPERAEMGGAHFRGSGSRAAWRISAALAVSAYVHYEAVYLVPAVIVGMGFSPGWFKRLLAVGARTTLLLAPWLVYVACNSGLFLEQMQIQFHRLSHHNHWMSNAYLVFHSLFLDHGSPTGWPKFFNVAKGLFWIGVAGLGICSLGVAAAPRRFFPRRALLASGVAFVFCFYLWATKAEVWFVALCHLAFWPWGGAALIFASGLRKPRLVRCVVNAMVGTYAFLALSACIWQASAISPTYTWPVYEAWVDCIERALGPLDTQPHLKLWQTYIPDVLVELSWRHPGWNLTRAMDFPARKPLALEAGKKMDAIIFSRYFNPKAELPEYFGPLRDEDRIRMSQTNEMPLGDWALGALEQEEPGQRDIRVCETGPFWAVVLARKPGMPGH